MNAADPGELPAALGYRMPPEWAPHAATWLSWPHNRETWPGRFEAAEAAYVQMALALAAAEPVHINVLSAAHRDHVRDLLDGAGLDHARCRFHELPTDDAWVRDHGATFVTRHGDTPLAAVDCEFNAWGGKYPPWDRDALVAARMAEILGVPRFAGGLVLEGGSIDVNGQGTLLTTEQCLLNPNRNPGMSRADIEARLAALFGITQVIWLGDGIDGDDTDGHIDDVARFVAPDHVVIVSEPDPADPNHSALADNLERLRAARLAGGRALKVTTLPMPAPLEVGGQRVPASYANFYIANGAVLLPVFGDPADRQAADTLAGCFPDRRILPVDCRALVPGFGAVHCLTQQLPAADLAHRAG